MRIKFKKTQRKPTHLADDARFFDGNVRDLPSFRAEKLLQTFPDNFEKIIESLVTTRIYPKRFTTYFNPPSKKKKAKGQLKFTYFYDVGGGASFALVARNQIRELRKLGYEVEEKKLNDIVSTGSYKNHFAIVHPFLFTLTARNSSFKKVIRNLSSSFRYLVGFDVADTTSINKKFVGWFNDPRINGICVPSEFSYNSYKQSGILNRVFVIPHGVNENFKPQRRLSIKPRVLGFIVHSHTRKGADIFAQIAKRFPRIEFIVKTGPYAGGNLPKTLRELDNVAIIEQILPEKELVKLYSSCDIFLYPYRSGAFELPALEAQACGAILIATGWGCILDYANLHNSYLSNITGYSDIFLANYLHNGLGAEPDVEDLTRLLTFVLDNLAGCRTQALKISKNIRRKFSWKKSAELLIEACEEIMEED